MTEEQRQRVLAGGDLISDTERDAAYHCACGRSLPVPHMPHDCQE